MAGRNATRAQQREERRAARAAASATRKLQPETVIQLIMRSINELLAMVLRPLAGLPSNGELRNAIASARQEIDAILDDDMSSELVRLAFHDCVGGMCDGCVDLTNPDNFGLEDPIDDLEDIVEDYAEFLTRGDVWVLAAYAALERQQNNNNNNNNNVRVSYDLQFVGRPSCDGDHTRGPDRTLPSPHLTTDSLVEFFDKEFGFDARETTAIMGAHTL